VGILDSVHTLLAMESSMDDALKKDELRTQRNINRKLSGSYLRKGKECWTDCKTSGWTPPPPGWTKINVDGSFLVATGAAAVGVVARDSSVHVLFTASRVLQRCADATEANAKHTWKA
jgi:hypothetical protein